MFRPKKKNLHLLLLGIITLILLHGCTTEVDSEITSYAGLVVKYADGHQTSMCIPFQGDEITGEELLNLSEIPYISDVTNPMGSRICSIDGEGCDFPAEKCFCQCGNIGPCTYWAYFALTEGGEWVYSPVGANMRKIHQGDVDAWVWLSKASKDVESVNPILPTITFDEICSNE
jgi:hypothetical protein